MRLAKLATLVVVAALVVGCGPVGAGSDETAPVATSPEPLSTVPAPAVTVTVAPPAPAEVLLTDQGIGTVTLGAPDGAYERLVELLGEATERPQESCAFWFARWGSLTVYLDGGDGAATGWSLTAGKLADSIRPPFDVYPGEGLHRVLDEGGQTAPFYSWEDGTQIDGYTTSIGTYEWSSESADPSSTVYRIDVASPGCD